MIIQECYRDCWRDTSVTIHACMVIKSSSLRSRNVQEMVTGTGINRWLANFNIFLNGLFGKINTLKSRKTHCNIYHTWIFMKPFFLRQISAFTMHPAGRIHNPHHHYDPLDRIYGAACHIPPTKASLLVSSDVVSSKIRHLQSWSAMEIKRSKPYPHPTRRCVEDANRS